MSVEPETAARRSRRANELGPTGDQVRANVQRLRKRQRLTKRELSDAVGAAGRPIPPLGISRIESGHRRVDADDLVALAIVLGVNPSALLLPPVALDGTIAITGAEAVPAKRAWDWADGCCRLVPSDDPTGDPLAFSLYARPPGRR